jgi:GT2 family glycosyltransferase
MLSDALESLASQDLESPTFEVLVVDDGSTDATRAVVTNFGSSMGGAPRYVWQNRRGLNAARNLAIEKSGAPWTAFLDDDELADETWLTNVLEAIDRHPDAGCISGRMIVQAESGSVRPPRTCHRCDLWEGTHDLGDEEVPVEVVIGGNMAVARWAVDRVGPFDARLSGSGDDQEWANRAAMGEIGMYYVPSAVVYHRRSSDQYRLSALTRKAYQRNREFALYQALNGDIPSVLAPLRGIPRNVFHATSRLCSAGLTNIAGCLGRAAGVRVARKGAAGHVGVAEQ